MPLNTQSNIINIDAVITSLQKSWGHKINQQYRNMNPLEYHPSNELWSYLHRIIQLKKLLSPQQKALSHSLSCVGLFVLSYNMFRIIGDIWYQNNGNPLTINVRNKFTGYVKQLMYYVRKFGYTFDQSKDTMIDTNNVIHACQKLYQYYENMSIGRYQTQLSELDRLAMFSEPDDTDSAWNDCYFERIMDNPDDEEAKQLLVINKWLIRLLNSNTKPHDTDYRLIQKMTY